MIEWLIHSFIDTHTIYIYTYTSPQHSQIKALNCSHTHPSKVQSGGLIHGTLPDSVYFWSNIVNNANLSIKYCCCSAQSDFHLACSSRAGQVNNFSNRARLEKSKFYKINIKHCMPTAFMAVWFGCETVVVCLVTAPHKATPGHTKPDKRKLKWYEIKWNKANCCSPSSSTYIRRWKSANRSNETVEWGEREKG